MTGGFHIVMNLIGCAGLGYDYIHELLGVFGDAHDETGLQRDVGDGFVFASGVAGGAKVMKPEVAGGGVFRGRLLFQDGAGQDDRARFGLRIFWSDDTGF